MSQDRLQPQRWELKYLINESITGSIRDFLTSYLDLDEYGVGRPDSAYPVHSLYLDSDDLKTCHDTLNGCKNRFKLRLRYYDDRPDTPVFFEIKSRVDNCILKQRCGVRRDAVPLLLAGQLPTPDQLFSREPRHMVALQRFNLRLHQLNARPKFHNTYMREAWVSRNDNSLRVTFDRNLRVEPCFQAKASTEMSQPVRVYPDVVILEVKFTTRFPIWLEEMVRKFGLMRYSAAKYVEGVLTLGEGRFHDGYRSNDWQGLTPAAHAVPQPFSTKHYE